MGKRVQKRDEYTIYTMDGEWTLGELKDLALEQCKFQVDNKEINILYRPITAHQAYDELLEVHDLIVIYNKMKTDAFDEFANWLTDEVYRILIVNKEDK